MSRLAEILSSGVAPGIRSGAKDPTSAEVAVPRAFRQLEQTMPAREIERQCGFKVKAIKKTWKF
jgi:hypothetical protein